MSDGNQLLKYGYIYLKDQLENKLFFYTNKNHKEIIIDSLKNENVSVKVDQQCDLLNYEIISKHFNAIVSYYQNFERNKIYFQNLDFWDNQLNIIKFFSDNDVLDFANAFIIKKQKSDNKEYFELRTDYRNDEILGSLILLTSSNNYGKYGQYFEYLKSMCLELKLHQKKMVKEMN